RHESRAVGDPGQASEVITRFPATGQCVPAEEPHPNTRSTDRAAQDPDTDKPLTEPASSRCAHTLWTVSEIEPPQLACLVDFAERPRIRDWSLRAALVRYAQPEPERVNRVVELVRRIEWALRSHRKAIERAGQEIWNGLQGD